MRQVVTPRRIEGRTGLLLVVASTLPLIMLFVDPIPQDPAYHAFADAAEMYGVPNFRNVASNIPFVVVGLAGLAMLIDSRRISLLPELAFLYFLLFAGLVLTGLGSAWYHLEPNNTTLVWDRLGITLTIAALFTIVLGEHVSKRWALRLILPLVIVGIASVLYWSFSEGLGVGDLRPYALVQFMPMILLPLILLTHPSPFDRHAFLWWAIGLYAVAKLFELFDGEVYRISGLVSGHSMKHIVSAAAMLVVLAGLRSRKLAGTP
jgi:hypothetical protein